MESIKFENGDMIFKHGQLLMVEGLECKIQKTKGLLSTSLGELFYNSEIGLSLKNILSIDNKKPTLEDKKMAIRECLSKDDNIEQIQVIDIIYNPQKRKDEITLKLKYKQQTNSIIVGGIEIE